MKLTMLQDSDAINWERTHLLKVDDPDVMYDLQLCRKTFEIRKNDRDYQEGDTLFMAYWDGEQYSSDYVMMRVSYLFEGGRYGIEKGYCVMAIEPVQLYSFFLTRKELFQMVLTRFQHHGNAHIKPK